MKIDDDGVLTLHERDALPPALDPGELKEFIRSVGENRGQGVASDMRNTSKLKSVSV